MQAAAIGKVKILGVMSGSAGKTGYPLSYKDLLSMDKSHAIGTGGFSLAKSISYQFDFWDPSMNIRQRAHRRMVGMHEACQSLASGACSSAIIAGTNSILNPSMTASMCSSMVQSHGGKCRTFGAKSDGYGRGEAIDVLYLKRLDDAIEANDPIREIIRSSMINCDGKTSCISIPSEIAQERLIREAYRRANISGLSRTAFIECHETRTRTGDKIETVAVTKAFEEKGIEIGVVIS